MLTDKLITSTISRFTAGDQGSVDLADPGERGAGRLHLQLRRHKDRVSSDWYATWHRSGKRRSAKIGRYPAMSLAAARHTFRQQYQPVILKGENPIGPRATRARGKGTVKELCEAYIDWLGDRPSAVTVRQVLLGANGAVLAIGPSRPAAAVRKEHIIPHLAEIYERGARVQANNVRNILHATFAYGIRSANSFSDRAGATDWALEFNPVSAIPATPNVCRPGTRALSAAELGSFWRWLEANRGANRAMDALQLMLATGQRPCEILQISADHYDSDAGLLRWSTTKNGRPHCIPLPPQAMQILDRMTPNEHGLYFKGGRDKSKHAATYTVARVVRRYASETGARPFEARDIRRTWKTLSGAAGISKEFRDRIQNHALNDVSARHYDMWEYMPEKRAAMATWAEYLDGILTTAAPPVYQQPPCAEVMTRLASLMGDSAWRAVPQASHHADWIGHAITEAFAINRTGAWRSTAWRQTVNLVQLGVLERATAKDAKHRDVPVFRLSGRSRDLGRGSALHDNPPPTLHSRQIKCSLEHALTPDRLGRLEELMTDKLWRAAPQARRQPDWIGLVLAEAFCIERAGSWATEVSRLAVSLSREGVLLPLAVEDQTGRKVPVYGFGRMATVPDPVAGEAFAKHLGARAGFYGSYNVL